MVQKEHTTATITTLTAGFQWKPEWRKQLPAVRGIHAPKMESLESLLARVPKLRDRDDSWSSFSLDDFLKAAPWVYVGSAGAAVFTHKAAHGLPDLALWLELLTQAASSEQIDFQARKGVQNGLEHTEKERDKTGYDKPLDWVTRICLARHGLFFTLDVALQLVAWSDKLKSRWFESGKQDWLRTLLAPLRQAIACASDEDCEKALAVAKAAKSQSAEMHRFCAHLFAHIGEWAQEWLTQHAEQNADLHGYLLRDCVLPASVFARYVEQHIDMMHTSRITQKSKLSMLLLQVHLHQDAALEAISPLLARAIKHEDKVALNMLLDVLVRLHVPQMPALLMTGIAVPKVRSAIEKLAAQFPAAVLKTAIEHSLAGRNRATENWTIRLALQHPDALPGTLAALEPSSRKRFETQWAALHREVAAPDNLPPLLREPPWLRADRPGELPAFDVPVITTPETLAWPQPTVWHQSSQEEAAKYTPSTWRVPESDEWGFPRTLGLRPSVSQRLLAGQPLQPGDVDEAVFRVDFDDLLRAPEPARLALFNAYPGMASRDWTTTRVIPALLASYGTAAFRGTVAFLTTHDGKAPWLASMVDSPGLVNHMLHGLRNVRLHKESAGRWIERFPRTVLFKALPQAFATQYSAGRDDARHAITWLAEKGHADLAREVAGIYCGAMPAALEALLTTDPIFLLPGVMPELPDFFVAASFRRPELLSGGALPVVAMEHIGRMLALEQPGVPYAGLDIVKQSCTRASLAEFAWDIYEAWDEAERPGKHRWAFTCLGLLGDDETARRLFTRINDWAANYALRARATEAMHMLKTIGSDVALMLLSVIAAKSKHKILQERAGVMIQGAAETRGLSLEELADRLVPALGLDQEAAFELDFGPRKFTLAFDEELKPVVMDSKGTRLKDLPKPNKSDDAVRAKATADRLKLLRKDARTLASLQITRMERAMVNARRWPLAEFKRFFIDHPLMRYLAARLVWGRYEGDQMVQALRIAEDWTLADGGDEWVERADDAVLGIPHVLEMNPSVLARFSQVFADYEILQPFKQLGRETYALTPDEQKQHILKRFEGQSVASGAIMSLQPRGWERGSPQDGGMICDYSRRSRDGLEVSLSISPGIFIGGGQMEPRQDIGELWLLRHTEGVAQQPATFDSLDTVFISEVLRDLSLLNPYNIMTAP
ncbi:MAG: DUF4132 domain-containing protein [Polaromonas sp.]|nr:MAG: DUF4132 domain-containing protein [Polaromonas sp.]